MKNIIFALALFAVFHNSVQAQTLYIGIGSGFSKMSPVNNYSFVYKTNFMPWPAHFEEISGQKADMGFNIVSILEFRMQNTPISLTGGLAYTQLYGGSDYIEAYSPPWYGTMITAGELKTRLNVTTISAGVQWHILSSPIYPYLTLNFLYNIIGDTKLSIEGSYLTTEATAEGTAGIGLSVGGGIRMNLLSSVDFKIGADYSLINLTPEEETRAMICLKMYLLFKII